MARAGIVIAAGEGETLAMGASSVRFLAQGDDADARFSLTDCALEPGFPGPKPHRHERMVDSFYVLEGTVRFLLGDEQLDAGPGTFVLVPPGVAHTFANPHAAPARLLNLQSPGGLEQYLKELAATTQGAGPPDPGEMARIASRYDFRAVE